MEKRIITISREFGSGGRFIGEEVAKKLGISYYDKDIIGQIAEQSGFSPEYIRENAELSPKKGLFAYAFSGRDITGKSVEDMVYEAQRNVILKIAEKESCVIIGRNADFILKDREDVLNVFALLPNASSFALTNYIMAGKLKQCLELLASERKHGTYILPLSATVAFKLRQVLRYLELKRRGYDQKGIMDELGMRSPYAYRFLERDSRHFDEKRLTEALLGLSDMNIKLRQGGRGYEKLEEILVRLLA